MYLWFVFRNMLIVIVNSMNNFDNCCDIRILNHRVNMSGPVCLWYRTIGVVSAYMRLGYKGLGINYSSFGPHCPDVDSILCMSVWPILRALSWVLPCSYRRQLRKSWCTVFVIYNNSSYRIDLSRKTQNMAALVHYIPLVLMLHLWFL